MDTKTTLESLGHIARRRGVSLFAVQRAAKKVNAEPVTHFGVIGAYDAETIATIEAELNRVAERRAGAHLVGAA